MSWFSTSIFRDAKLGSWLSLVKKLLSVVVLLEDIPDNALVRSQAGTGGGEPGSGGYEVEFSDETGVPVPWSSRRPASSCGCIANLFAKVP